MFADENLRGENRKLGRTALGNEHDVQEGIGDAGFWCDWDTARDIASICNNHIVEIKLEAFSVVERDRRRVTAQFSKCCRGATQVSEWSPRSLHFGCEFFVHYAAESTGRNIHKIADAIASDADKIDGAAPTGDDLFNGSVKSGWHSECPRKIVARPKREHRKSSIAACLSDSIHYFVQSSVATGRHDHIKIRCFPGEFFRVAGPLADAEALRAKPAQPFLGGGDVVHRAGDWIENNAGSHRNRRIRHD